MHKFIKNVLSISFSVIFITWAINFAYVAFDCTDQDNVKKFKLVPESLLVCNFGSSHGLYGFDYQNYEKNRCFNFGLSSQTLDYDYRVMQQYQSSIRKGTIVYIPISYFSLFGQDEIYDKDFAAKNKRYYYFLEPELIKGYESDFGMIIRYCPVLTSPSNVLKLLTGKLGKNENMEIWMRKSHDVDVNKDAIAAYERHVKNKFDKEGNRIISKEAISALNNMIDLCRSRGGIPILLTVPFLREYTDTIKRNDKEFMRDFHGVVNKIVEEKNVRYYDYGEDERFKDKYELFMNSDHLNKDGAIFFTEILLKETLITR